MSESVSSVSAVAVPTYDLLLMCAAVRRHFEATGFLQLLTPDKKVVLKPNLLMRRDPDRATTTHPVLVHAVIVELQKLGITNITIADSPGGPYTKALLDSVNKTCGMTRVAEETGAVLNEDYTFETLHSPVENGLCSSFNIIAPMIGADIVINLAKLKTHAMTTLSGAVKNMLGCVPGLQKPELHLRFPQRVHFGRMLVELSQVVRSDLTIVDAVVSMEGNGPSAGTPRETGWTFAGRDVYALDVALCEFAGLPQEQVPTIAASRQSGLLPEQVELQWLCDGRPPDQTPFRLPDSREPSFDGNVPVPFRSVYRKMRERFLSPRPVIRAKQCIGCAKCAESCPADTIEMRGRKAVIHYQNCIKCYCCHEMCPVGAIEISRFRLLNL